MKSYFAKLLLLAGLTLTQTTDSQAQAAVGTVANDQTYAEFSGSTTITDANLRDHVGKVVVIYYYTPW